MNFEDRVAKRAKSIEISTIRYFFNMAREVPGAISLAIGEPDFVTPQHIREAAKKALDEGKTGYTVNPGLIELRQEISNYLKRRYNLSYNSETEILVTIGATEAIYVALNTLVEEGDEVLIPEPSFVAYHPCTILAGAKSVFVPTYEEDDFVLRADVLEKYITDKSKVLILPYPNNPTGAVMPKEAMEKIAEVVKKHDLIVVTDEIYSELIYSGFEHVSFASLKDMWERTVTINGFSKSYAMTGWRLGYIAAPEYFVKHMTKVHQYSVTAAATMCQYAGIEAIKNGDEDILKMREEYDRRRKYLLQSVREMGLDCFEPKGAFYIFPSIKKTGLTSEEFAKRLLFEAKVAVVPGNAFGENGEGYVRMAYATSMENLEEAVKRMKEFMSKF
ncbi:aminotransferase class I/II-fold pyridoxal phosphate-dependent enzyme [Thermoanaerobacter sp. CM-CNRG TB177]|jgi:aminotransferase|uniref:pyridoxal phosphate-dependent aminotransferase n=1 Tax=Thermoanaerobacter sp. CM-CNRG TB177 TaxID=2800659 RepID=UPI001BDF0218|nr:aminotransferase class I/II-fold pyridoxal phosphate-dependent enzyme [Thermoanaerobacter sp. CM-CNRG TB177]MBT1280163.1 aminotransferase class I/II-fold pyridoxal phosphate-dependent enzyme [Thermoanaerobacter sp. CM-CNRG TB177]